MTTYQIQAIEETGVYVVVTNDDGSSFGQMVQNVDLSSEEAALKSIKSQVEDVIVRTSARIRLSDLAKHAGSIVELDPTP